MHRLAQAYKIEIYIFKKELKVFLSGYARCLKITEKNLVMTGKISIKSAKIGPFWQIFET